MHRKTTHPTILTLSIALVGHGSRNCHELTAHWMWTVRILSDTCPEVSCRCLSCLCNVWVVYRKCWALKAQTLVVNTRGREDTFRETPTGKWRPGQGMPHIRCLIVDFLFFVDFVSLVLLWAYARLYASNVYSVVQYVYICLYSLAPSGGR